MGATILPIGEWLPDQPALAGGAGTIQNVVPLTKASYGPMPTPEVFSTALTARCQGAFSFLDNSQSGSIFAGDATKLYRLTAGSTPNFANVSKGGGAPYNTASPINPAIPIAPFWSMTSFGLRIIATNYADAVQTFLVGTDAAFSDLAAAAPKARFAAVIRDFAILGNTSDATDGTQVRRAWWSAIGDPTSWPTPGTNAATQVQSDYQDLQQSDLGQMTGLIGGHLSAADGAIFMERGIYRVAYVGAGAGIFAFEVAEGAAGSSSPLSIVQARMQTAIGNRSVAYYLGEDGFAAFDGVSSLPIGAQKVDRWFFNDLAAPYLSMVQGGAWPGRPVVYWLYTSAAGGQAGIYDRMLLFHTVLQRWAFVDLAATPAEFALRAMTPGYTLDALDVFGTVDAQPAPFGSGLYTSGSPLLAMFDTQHKLNFFTGTAMAATVETGESQPSPGRRSKILSSRPLVENDVGTGASVAIGVRDRLSDNVVFGAATAMGQTGECFQRTTGRYVKAQMTVAAATLQPQAHLSGVELTVRPEGRR